MSCRRRRPESVACGMEYRDRFGPGPENSITLPRGCRPGGRPGPPRRGGPRRSSRRREFSARDRGLTGPRPGRNRGIDSPLPMKSSTRRSLPMKSSTKRRSIVRRPASGSPMPDPRERRGPGAGRSGAARSGSAGVPPAGKGPLPGSAGVPPAGKGPLPGSAGVPPAGKGPLPGSAGVPPAGKGPLPGSAGVSPALAPPALAMWRASGGGPSVRACGRDARAPRFAAGAWFHLRRVG